LIQSVSILTAVTVDYVPQTVVTLKSAHRTGSFHSFYVFVADAPSDTVEKIRLILADDVPWLHVFGPENLGSERTAFMRVFSYFNRFEIANLAKYVGLSHVLKDPSVGDACVFVDSDTLFFNDVCPLIKDMGNKAVYLTPQLLESTNSDTEHDVMTHGWINAGFLGFNCKHEGTARILKWLIDRISSRGHLAPHLGLSCDQTWVSALPVLFRDLVAVSHYKGLNVAYWNLDKRPLTRAPDDEILAGENPLVMFHFSGFDEANSQILSKHAAVTVETGSILDELCNVYRNALQDSKKVRERMKGLNALPCATGNLAARIKASADEHQVNLYKTMVRPGIFTRLGGIADAVVRKIFNLIGA
jgi:lipopolysaccharide biosynthesis glycosyltransferase